MKYLEGARAVEGESRLNLDTTGPLYGRVRKREMDVSAGGPMDRIVDYTLIETSRVVEGRRQLLLGFKKRGFGVGKYNGFGGKFDAGETAEECARRELQEESVWKAQLLFTFRDASKLMRVHVFQATRFHGDPVETEEMRPEWFDVDKLPLSQMWHDDTFWMPIFLEGTTFEAWFDYAAGGEEVNTVMEYQLNKLSAPTTPSTKTAERSECSPP